MGYYIDTPVNHGKAGWLEDNHGATVLAGPPSSLAPIPDDLALVVVVDNIIFEAAGYVYDDAELRAFTVPDDRRAKTWLLMDKVTARKLSGYE